MSRTAPRLDGRALYLRIREGDLDSIDVGDFLDACLDGEDPDEGHIPGLDGVAAFFTAPASGEDGTYEVWRAVVVRGDAEAWASEPVGPDGIGECWSFGIEGASPYGGGLEGGERRIIHGRVRAGDVDWAATCIMQTVKPEQSECRVLPTALVEVLGILDGNTLRGIECPCAGETFPAGAGSAVPAP